MSGDDNRGLIMTRQYSRHEGERPSEFRDFFLVTAYCVNVLAPFQKFFYPRDALVLDRALLGYFLQK